MPPEASYENYPSSHFIQQHPLMFSGFAPFFVNLFVILKKQPHLMLQFLKSQIQKAAVYNSWERLGPTPKLCLPGSPDLGG